MILIFLILAALTLAGTAAAMFLRNPIHCILALTVGLVGLAMLYLQLGAQFVGFTQVLVYVGAVAILAVFAIMMTQGGKPMAEFTGRRGLSAALVKGSAVAAALFAVLAWAIGSNPLPAPRLPPAHFVSVSQIGESLMRQYALPLEIMGLLLTAALIGAVIIALPVTSKKARP